ncbi:MAG: GAF domain-containing protein [Anaerolineales bacterium]
MNEAKTFSPAAVTVREFWNRLAPLLVLGFQAFVLVLMILAAVLALNWFQQPSLGFFVDPAMVIGNVQPPQYGWEKQTYRDEIPQQDELVAINHQDVSNVQDLQQVLGQVQVGDQVELFLQARSGHELTQTVTLGEFSTYEQLIYFFLPYLLAVVFLGAGFWSVRVHLDDPSARVFGVLTASLALALAARFDLWSSHRMVIFWLFSMGISGGALLHFLMLFPTKYRLYSRYPYLGWAGYLVGFGLAGKAVYTLQNYTFPFQLAESWQPLWIFVGLCLLAFYVGMVVRRYVSASPVELEQSRIVLWGSGLSLLPLAVYLLGQIIPLDGLQIPQVVAVVPLVLFPLSIAYAVLRYRVVNTDLLISRTLVYALLTILAGAGYAALISGLSILFNDLVTVDNPFLIGGVVFILALMINPFRKQVQTMLDTIFFRGEGAYQQYVEAFADQISQTVELSAIAGLIREYVNQHLEPLRLHIYVYDTLVDRYVPTDGEDGRPTTDIRFPRNSGLVHRLSSKRTTFFLDLQNTLPQELQNERARLALLGAQLFLALPGQERLSGWLALGPRASGERYTGNDLEFLSAIAVHAANAIERAQVMVDKDRRVHEMNVLTRVAKGINVTINFDDILELIYAQTRQVIPVDDFNITLFSEATNHLRHVFLVQQDDRISELENEIIPLGYGLEREVLQLRRPIITDDYQQECRNRRSIPNKKGIYAWMGVPLNAGAEVIGVIAVGSYNPAILYTEDQYNILQAIADQAAGAIVKARLLEETETRARQLASLNEVTRGLTSTLEIDPLLKDIMSSAVEILNCEAGSLLLVDPETQELVYEVVIGPVADEFLGSRQPLGVGLAGKVAGSMQPMIVNNVEQSPDWNSTPDQETGFVTGADALQRQCDRRFGSD